MKPVKYISLSLLGLSLGLSTGCGEGAGQVANKIPNIILVMSDDQGWGQTGYYNHPVLKTPNLDEMARNGLRFDRFYAGAPNCSPTRATVLTGRSNDRTGVRNQGFPLRTQEKTLAQALQKAGYTTGHFGKWHLNGLKGVGVPVLASDKRHPGVFGFDEWLSVTNYFDRDPVLGRDGVYEAFTGDSSEIVVAEALKFVTTNARQKKPFLAVIWFGSPHRPYRADENDRRPFADLEEEAQHHYGELVAMDRSIGTLRKGLRDLGIAEDTLLWFCSDNGGLAGIQPGTVGGLRGFKGSVYEGGLRVPSVVEWPAVITKPRVTTYPVSTMDIFPTLVEVVDLPESALLKPYDGIGIRSLFQGEIGKRESPIFFRHDGSVAMIDNDHKLLFEKVKNGKYQLYDLASDPKEARDLFETHPDVATRMMKELEVWMKSVDRSIAGDDYPGGLIPEADPKPRRWKDVPEYRSARDAFRKNSSK